MHIGRHRLRHNINYNPHPFRHYELATRGFISFHLQVRYIFKQPKCVKWSICIHKYRPQSPTQSAYDLCKYACATVFHPSNSWNPIHKIYILWLFTSFTSWVFDGDVNNDFCGIFRFQPKRYANILARRVCHFQNCWACHRLSIKCVYSARWNQPHKRCECEMNDWMKPKF